ncbi:glycoside hydrolase family 3 N-terminal domain-containing protein [Phreatobacter stygius]|nr:glycoside hydrolase family 3 N-terminal domain-containing protein [Phreatobacter stygius]
MPTVLVRALAFTLMTLSLATLSAVPLSAQADRGLAWRTGDEAQAIERRVEALLARMTLDEKIGQLNLTGRGDGFDPQWVATGRSGAVMNFIDPAEVRRLQDLVQASRLKIPLIIGLDAIHGFATYFPQPIGQAATFDPRLIELAAYWTARESRAAGVNWTFAPMVDLTRDPRWGRVFEGAGEDVHLATIVAAARVRGYHRGGLGTSVKHFAGYGEAEAGRDYNSVWIPPSKLLDLHVPPFLAAIRAGAFTAMTSLSAMNGVPATADRPLLTGLLKGRLGFRGFVVSDFASIEELINHGVAADGAEAARKALLAGVDMDMFSGLFIRHLADEVRAERVPVAAIDEAVRRILRVKFHMGLFDAPPVDPAATAGQITTQPAREAALEVAREAMVLLKNDGDILPIRPDVRSIAVIGALGMIDDDWQYGDNVGLPRIRRPTVQGELARQLGPDVKITAQAGLTTICGTEFADREATLRAAREADLIVAVLGEECEFMGESASRTRLDLPGVQGQLLDDLIATGKPVVLVLKTARPLVLTDIAARVPAIIQSFHLGSQGRVAIGEVLTGRVNPSGKLPMSMPRSVGQIPVYYDQLPTGRPLRKGERYETSFVDERNEPLFPFGFGLSYTRFTLDALTLDSASVPLNGTIAGSVRLANVGSRDGREVVQVYLRQRVGSRSRPLRQLRAFDKVTLGAGASQTVRFAVPVEALGFHDDQGRRHLEPGLYDVFVGTDSRAELTATVTVRGRVANND